MTLYIIIHNYKLLGTIYIGLFVILLIVLFYRDIKMRKKTQIYNGMLGGGVVIASFLIVLLSLNLFNYRIHIDDININALKLSDVIVLDNSIDSTYNTHIEAKNLLIESLKKDKSILTPQEYTNNIVNYYNSILFILSVLLAAFSALSFVYIKSQSSDWIQEKLQSDEFKEEVSEVLIGKAENRLRDQMSTLETKISLMENKVAELYENRSSSDSDNIELE